jgi:hypothetical protein
MNPGLIQRVLMVGPAEPFNKETNGSTIARPCGYSYHKRRIPYYYMRGAPVHSHAYPPPRQKWVGGPLLFYSRAPLHIIANSLLMVESPKILWAIPTLPHRLGGASP